MRSRSVLFLAALLMLTASLASVAAPAAPAGAPAVAPPASAPAQLAPSCDGGSAQQEALPFIPSPSAKSSLCGSCSPSNCQGLNINASCYYLTRTGYAIGKCHADSVCSGAGFSALCICRNGPEV